MNKSILDKLESIIHIAIPRPHFMAFAPLDCWLKLILKHAVHIQPKYWLRLASILFTSLIATAVTLPERIIFAPIIYQKYKSHNNKLNHKPGAVLILGYYRSGTTHLHYLLSCDPQFKTPKWFHALAPHGYIFSWTFFRLFLIPFMSPKRPQDNVAYGPEWPAEDDFALNNWKLASSLPGRFVLPHEYQHYKRYHSLIHLSQDEFKIWQKYQWAFLWKLITVARQKILLLKTPSHTARIPALLELLSDETDNHSNIKFIHIARNPYDVIKSNLSMAHNLSSHRLQNMPDDEEIKNRIVEEYLQTINKYTTDKIKIPAGNLCEILYDELRENPVVTIKKIYTELSIPASTEFEQKVKAYLQSIRDYQPSQHKPGAITYTQEQKKQLDIIAKQYQQQLAESEILKQKPACETIEIVTPQITDNKSQYTIITKAIFTTLFCCVIWITLANIFQNRYDNFVWPAGIVIGYKTLKYNSGNGSIKLGIIAALLTLLALLIVSFPNTRTIHYGSYAEVPFKVLWETTWHELKAGPTIFWTFMGMFTAYRFGSRSRLYPGQ